MWTIRQEQMEIFARAAEDAFEERTYLHLTEYFPHHCELLGANQMRLVIRHGWKKANSYGLTAECCVRSYIEFMCLLGSNFDTDILLPWAAEILNDQGDQVSRGDRLYYKMWDYIDHIAADYRDSSGRPTTARFMDDLRALRHPDKKATTLSQMLQFLSSLEQRLHSLFPAKCLYVGEQRVRGAISQSVEFAAQYGITGERGLTLFSGIRFVLGAGFAHDPLIPWASAVLNDLTVLDQYKKIDKLYAEAIAFLKRWWKASSGQDFGNVLG